MRWGFIPGSWILVIWVTATIRTVASQCDGHPLSLSITIQSDIIISLPNSSTSNGNYNNDLDCEWELTYHNALRLEFVTFDLVSSPQCVGDYLAVYTGSKPNDKLVDRWCGSTYPTQLVLERIRIVFHSDGEETAKGFSLKINRVTISSFNNVTSLFALSENLTLLYAPFYGAYAERNLKYTWEFTNSDRSKLIELEFKSVCEDVDVQILEVPSNWSNDTSLVPRDLLQHKCTDTLIDVIFSEAQTLVVKVDTDIYDTKFPEFRLSVSLVDKYDFKNSGTDVVHNIAVGETPKYLYMSEEAEGKFISRSEMTCLWHIITETPHHMVAVELLLYDSVYKYQCERNGIAFYNGVDQHGMKIASICKEDLFMVYSPQVYINATMPIILNTDRPKRKMVIMKIYSVNVCDVNKRKRFAARTEKSYAVLDNNAGIDCTWEITALDTSRKLVTVGTETDAYKRYNVNPNCPVNLTASMLHVYEDVHLLNAVQHICRYLNSQDFRVYNKSAYLPLATNQNKERVVYFYTSQGLCDKEVITLEAILEKQSILSPYYQEGFMAGENCRWKLHSFDPNYDVAFRVTTFASSQIYSTCHNDKTNLAFYNGIVAASYKKIILRCPGRGTDWYKSFGRYIYAEFVSVGFADTGGFQIEYAAVRKDSSCNKELQASATTSQNLSSPGFPSLTERSQECWWKFTAEDSLHVVLLKVLETSLAYQDYAKVYDGKDISEGLLYQWSGTRTPIIQSSGRYLFLEYKMLHVESRGFLLSYNSTKASRNRCGEALTAFDYNLYMSSPNYPKNYKNNMLCQWTIRTSSPMRMVKIEVLDLELEYDCSFDNISVYDGSDDTGVLLQSFCGHSQPTLQSNGRNMYIRFRSDSTRTHRGFRIKFYETADVPPHLACNKFLQSYNELRFIESPGYPQKYLSNLRCWWHITAEDSSAHVEVNFLNVHLEYSQFCNNDYIAVHDVNSEGEQLGRFCGTQTPSYTSRSKYIYIYFQTNSDINSQGFRFSYKTTRACVEGYVTELYAQFSSNYIESPSYPNSYPNGANCMWRIYANVTRYIQLTVLTSEIENGEHCQYDYMAAYDGYSDGAPVLDKWCGTETPTVTSSYGGIMFLRFRSDGSNNDRGFRVKYAGVTSPSYGPSGTSNDNNPGMIAGVVCGIFIIAGILIAIIFIVIRRRQKNQRRDAINQNIRNDDQSRWRTPRYREQGPWEVNQVFYSEQSGEYIMATPPPYSLVAGPPIPNEPPPPYPAAEFALPMKDEDAAPPYEESQRVASTLAGMAAQLRPANNIESIPLSGNTDPLPIISRENMAAIPLVVDINTDSPEDVHFAPVRAADAREGETSRTQDEANTRGRQRQNADRPRQDLASASVSPSRDHQSNPRAKRRKHPRSNERNDVSSPTRSPKNRGHNGIARSSSAERLNGALSFPAAGVPHSRQLDRQNKALSVGSLNQNLSLVTEPTVTRPHLDGTRAVSVGNLQASSQIQPVEMSSQPTANLRNHPVPSARNRPNQRQPTPHPAERRRNTAETFGNMPVESENRQRPKPKQRYMRKPKKHPRDDPTDPRQQSMFDALRTRSHSFDNLNSDNQPSTRGSNPRWSVASEGYINSALSGSAGALGAHPRWSLAPETLDSRSVVGDPRSHSRKTGRSHHGSRQAGSGNRGSVPELSDQGDHQASPSRVEDLGPGYAVRPESSSQIGPTETSV